MMWRGRAGVFAGVLVLWGCGSTGSNPAGVAGTTGATSPGSGGDDQGGSASGSFGGGAGGSTATAGSTAMAGNGSDAGTGGMEASACMARTTNHVAGTRIKLRTVVTAEGDEAWMGFYDSTTGKDCAATLADDGKMHCLPKSIGGVNTFYTDASCSDAVYQPGAAGNCSFELLALNDYTDPCDWKRTLFAPGEAFSGPAFRKAPGGACEPVPPEIATDRLVRRGAPVDPTQFAELEPAQRPGSGRIARVGYKSADGAFLVSSYHDTELDADCQFVSLGDGKLSCEPSGVSSSSFSDTTCTTGLLSLGNAACASHTGHFVRTESSGCNRKITVLRSGALYTGTVYQHDATGGCSSPVTPETDTQFVTLTELPDITLPQATSTTVDSDPGRLKPRYRTSSDGSCSFDDFWDSELGMGCQFVGTAATGYFCYPHGEFYGTDGFSDAGCSVAVRYLTTQSCFADRVPTYVTDTTYAECNVPSYSVRKVGAGVLGADVTVYQGSPGACSRRQLGADTTYFEFGPALPAETFVRGEPAP